MQEKNEMLPEIIVFAGPNGSGKTTVTSLAKVIAPYINADDIKIATHCSDLEAAINAEKLRENAMQKRESFTFETVLSTNRNLNLLKRAKENGYFIRCIYVLTSAPDINVLRVEAREANGGHGVPIEKIKNRYQKCMGLLPDYLCYVVKHMHLEKYYTGATIPHIYFKDYKNEEFTLDSLDRQAKIVGILSKCESIINTYNMEINKLDNLIKSRFVGRKRKFILCFSLLFEIIDL